MKKFGQPVVALVSLFFLASSCATHSSRQQTQSKPQDTLLSNQHAIQEQTTQRDSQKLSTIIRRNQPKPRFIKYDFPIVRNKRVDAWINYFTTRGRDWFQEALNKGARYIPVMREILVSEGLPGDLVYLALIESGFKKHAYSRAHAVGQWQFIRATGKSMGLDINIWIDERRDPIKATEAAAKFLKHLKEEFGNWYLATAAYNAGPNKIRRAIKRYKSRNYWIISKYRYLRRETKNYVPKLIAAIILAKHHDKFGFTIPSGIEPVTYKLVKTSKPVDLDKLSEYMGIQHAVLRNLNGELRYAVTPPGSYEIKVPTHLSEKALEGLTHAHSSMPSKEFITYRVRRGDTLYGISRRHGTRVSTLMSLNNLSYRQARRLSIGKRLVVPIGSGPRLVKRGKNFDLYRVRSGDSLYRISRRFGTSIRALMEANSLSKRQARYLQVGKHLRIPKGTAAIRTKNGLVHVVSKGESLWSISRKYRVSIKRIKRENGVSALIKPGQRLIIPKT